MIKAAEERIKAKLKKEKEKIDTLNQADSLIFQTEKQITEFDEKLNELSNVKGITINENLAIKVGDSIFSGKITKVTNI